MVRRRGLEALNSLNHSHSRKVKQTFQEIEVHIPERRAQCRGQKEVFRDVVAVGL